MLIRLMLFALVGLAALGFIAYQLGKFFLAINSTRNKVEKDKLNLLQDLYEDYDENLVLMDPDEFKLLSLAFEENSSTDTLGKITQGYYKSIYDEALISYATKDYYESEHYLAVMRTKTESFIFHQVAENTEVIKNGKKLGDINANGELKDERKMLLASLDSSGGEYHLIYDNKKEMVHLRNSKNADIGNQRAFPIVEDLDDSNRDMVLVMALYDLLVKND